MKKTVLYIIAALLLIAAAAILLFLPRYLNTDPHDAATPYSRATVTLTEAPTEAPTAPDSYMIEGVDVIPQEEFKAGCETYACTMLLQTLGYDMDEHLFLENYLDIHWVYWGSDGKRYGPDMNSAQAGDIEKGWGVYAPAMAKFMNHYLSDEGSDQKATALEGVSLSQLCDTYVGFGIPVMVWATTYMMEPYEKDSWIVDYVDENAKYELGDTFTWLQNEHCLVLIGYDEDNYYFADSCAGKVSVFDRELSEQRYEQLGMQAIVVE